VVDDGVINLAYDVDTEFLRERGREGEIRLVSGKVM
jgi:hypothetical protein